MRKYKKVKKETKILKQVFCNFCEKEITVEIDDDIVSIEGAHIEVDFAYHSEFECMSFDGDICDNCFKTVFKGKLRMSCDGQHLICHDNPCIEEE